MPLFIFISHANKAYKNGKAMTEKHDPPITPIGITKCESVAKHLSSKYGQPDIILTSPFKRCRQTAAEFGYTNIVVNTSLAEYLGHQNDALDVSAETSTYNIPYPETMAQFKERIVDFCHQMLSMSHGVIWCVTHGIVINELRTILNIHKSRYTKCLGYECVSQEFMRDKIEHFIGQNDIDTKMTNEELCIITFTSVCDDLRCDTIKVKVGSLITLCAYPCQGICVSNDTVIKGKAITSWLPNHNIYGPVRIKHNDAYQDQPGMVEITPDGNINISRNWDASLPFTAGTTISIEAFTLSWSI